MTVKIFHFILLNFLFFILFCFELLCCLHCFALLCIALLCSIWFYSVVPDRQEAEAEAQWSRLLRAVHGGVGHHSGKALRWVWAGWVHWTAWQVRPCHPLNPSEVLNWSKLTLRFGVLIFQAHSEETRASQHVWDLGKRSEIWLKIYLSSLNYRRSLCNSGF